MINHTHEDSPQPLKKEINIKQIRGHQSINLAELAESTGGGVVSKYDRMETVTQEDDTNTHKMMPKRTLT
jgi:hypothetical protein